MMKLYFTFLVTCSALCLSAQQIFIAHRGASYLAPENTVAADHGLEVLAWTVDDPSEAKRLTELGVSGIITNRPAWLKEQIEDL